MTEIEKMFENAGVEPIDSKLEPMGTLKFSVDDIDNTWTREQYMKEVPIYPPFTAEKQIEIVKFMLHKGIYYDTDGDTYWFHYTDEIENATYRPFEEAIAEFINSFWQYLIEKEKEEIRRILNENS